NVPGFGNNLLIGQKPLTNKDQFIQRVDFNESNSSSWFGRYSWGDEALKQPALFENGRNILTHVWQAMISNTRVLSPTKVNEFRFGTNYFFNSTGRELAFKKNVITEVGLPNFPSPDPVSWGIPAVSIDGFSGFGDDFEGPYVNPNLTLHYGRPYQFVPPWLDTGQSEVDAYVPFIATTPNVADMSRHPVLVRVGSGDFYQNKIMRFNPAIQTARDGRLGDRLITTDYTNFAPRLGISWSPGPKWTVRTGAGIFYAQDTGNPRF